MNQPSSAAGHNQPDRLPQFFALIWRAAQKDEDFDPQEFEKRIPRLMEWLRELREQGHLVACGGGGFVEHAGGLTIIRAADVDEALRLSAGSPMNEIGQTDLMVWDTYFANLVVERDF